MEKKLKTISIKGKEYVQVNDRVKAFRENKEFEGWTIQTTIHELTNDVCVMCASVKDTQGRVIATGWAREVRTDTASMVNKTSYVENCETSAVGRALGFLGVGIDTSICSAQELLYAINAQNNAPDATKSHAQISTQAETKDAPKTDLFADDAYTGFCADIDAAESMEMLRATMTLAQGRPFYDKLRTRANNVAKERGWV